MRLRRPDLTWAALGIGLWLMDCWGLMLARKLSFGAAFWLEVSPWRLLARLVVVTICFFPALNYSLKRAGRKRQLAAWKEEHNLDLWQGAPDSPDKHKRLFFYGLRLANALRLSAYEQDKLRRLCYTYDLGHYLLDAEREQVHGWERQIELGARIAREFRMLETIVPLILAHEEYYNGSGYYCLSGSRIPIQCRILQVVMLFDHACGGRRPKRRAALMEALDELTYYSGTVLDPELVAAFQRLMRRRRLEQEEQEQLMNLP